MLANTYVSSQRTTMVSVWMILSIASSALLAEAKLVTYLTYINSTSDPKYCNISVNLSQSKDDPYKYGIGIDIFALIPIKTLFLDFQLYRKLSSHNSSSYSRMYQVTVDMCKMFERGSFRDRFIVYLYDLVKKSGNIPARCPIKPVSIFRLFHFASISFRHN